MGCAPFDLKCALKNTPLGPIAKALDKPLQAATSVAAIALKGTPLENVAKAVNQVNTGQYKSAGGTAFKGAIDIVKAVVPGAAEVPGIGFGTDLAASLIDGAINPKKAGGASIASAVASAAQGAIGGIAGATGLPVPNLSGIIGPNSPLGPLLTTKPSTPPQPAPPRMATTATNVAGLTPLGAGAQSVVQEQAAVVNPPPVQYIGTKRAPRKFTPEQFRAFVADKNTVGGTQMWGVQ